MTTPKRKDIIERAFEIHQQRSHSVNSNNPEIDELKESGIWKEARDSLMRSEDSEYVSFIEKEARSLGLIDDNIELGKQRKPYDFEIDVEESKRSGVFICGGKGTTKTNLAKIIAHKLLKLGYTVKVFDISRAWLKSSIPYVYEIERATQKISSNRYQSCVFDLSRLTPKDVKRFIARILAEEWNKQVDISEDQRKWVIYVFEECQILVPQGHLRSNEAQQVLRLMSSGRNFKLGYVAITQRPALTDTSVFELTFQRYFARMDGFNDLKKVSAYIGVERARQLQNLKLGEFIYDKGNETKWIHTKEFKPKNRPRKLEVPQYLEQVPETVPKFGTKRKQHHDNAKAISSLIVALIWLAAILLVIKVNFPA